MKKSRFALLMMSLTLSVAAAAATVDFVPRPITDAAKYTRSVPKEFIAKNGHDVTPAFIEYAKPIVGEIPHCEIF